MTKPTRVKVSRHVINGYVLRLLRDDDVQADVAEFCNVGQSTWSKKERGESPVLFEEVRKFCEFCDLEVEAYLTKVLDVERILKAQGIAVVSLDDADEGISLNYRNLEKLLQS